MSHFCFHKVNAFGYNISYYLAVVFFKDFFIYANEHTRLYAKKHIRTAHNRDKISKHSSGGSKALDLLKKTFFLMPQICSEC